MWVGQRRDLEAGYCFVFVLFERNLHCLDCHSGEVKIIVYV